jgi:hypothetical protein
MQRRIPCEAPRIPSAKDMDLKELSRGFGIEEEDEEEEEAGKGGSAQVEGGELVKMSSERSTIDHGSQDSLSDASDEDEEGGGGNRADDEEEEVMTNPSEEEIGFEDHRRFSMGTEAFGRKIRSRRGRVDDASGSDSNNDGYVTTSDEEERRDRPSRKSSETPRNPDNWLSGGADAESMLSNPSDEDDDRAGSSEDDNEPRINPDFVFPAHRVIRPLPMPPTELPQGVESAHDSYAHSRETSNPSPAPLQQPNFTFGHHGPHHSRGNSSSAGAPKLNAFAPEFKPTFTFQAPNDGPRMATTGLGFGSSSQQEDKTEQRGGFAPAVGPSKRQKRDSGKGVWLSGTDEEDDGSGAGGLGVPKNSRQSPGDDGEISPGRRAMLEFKFPPPQRLAGETAAAAAAEDATTFAERGDEKQGRATFHQFATVGRSSGNPTRRSGGGGSSDVPNRQPRASASAEARHSLIGLSDGQGQQLPREASLSHTPSKQRPQLSYLFPSGVDESVGSSGTVGSSSSPPAPGGGAHRTWQQFFTPPQGDGVSSADRRREQQQQQQAGSPLMFDEGDDMNLPTLTRATRKAIPIEGNTPVDVSDEEEGEEGDDEVRTWYGCGQCGHCAEDEPEYCQEGSLAVEGGRRNRGGHVSTSGGEDRSEEEEESEDIESGEEEEDDEDDDSPSWNVFEQILDSKLGSLREELVGATSLRADLDSLKRDALLDDVVQRLEGRFGEWVGKFVADRRLVEEEGQGKVLVAGDTSPALASRDGLVLAIVEGLRDELPLAWRQHPEDREKLAETLLGTLRPMLEKISVRGQQPEQPVVPRSSDSDSAVLAKVDERLAVLDGLHMSLLNGLTPSLEALRPTPLDTDELTLKLSEAVKPRIIELIDFASDKKETAALITSQLQPEFARLERAPPVDVEAISMSVLEAIKPHISAVAETRHDQIRDTVAERVTRDVSALLSERLSALPSAAQQQPSLDVTELAAKLGDPINGLLEKFETSNDALKERFEEFSKDTRIQTSLVTVQETLEAELRLRHDELKEVVQIFAREAAQDRVEAAKVVELERELAKARAEYGKVRSEKAVVADRSEADRTRFATETQELRDVLQKREEEVEELKSTLKAKLAAFHELEAAKARAEEKLAHSEGIRAEQSAADLQHTYQLGQCVSFLLRFVAKWCGS